MYENSTSFTFFPEFDIVRLLDFSHLLGVKWYLIVDLICVFLMSKDLVINIGHLSKFYEVFVQVHHCRHLELALT